jgi:hypothetical protein
MYIDSMFIIILIVVMLPFYMCVYCRRSKYEKSEEAADVAQEPGITSTDGVLQYDLSKYAPSSVMVTTPYGMRPFSPRSHHQRSIQLDDRDVLHAAAHDYMVCVYLFILIRTILFVLIRHPLRVRHIHQQQQCSSRHHHIYTHHTIKRRRRRQVIHRI